ncbi:AIM24 family protein [Kitasatospora sp. NPDC101801]|uniref:AIM24 family protein n=1 Tax=Kitasatospora sp. NPDC101801 TaxID=3364103 RepID=UPI0038070EFB
MQSPLLAHTAGTSTDRFGLQNPQLLRVVLDGTSEVLARSGAMVAHVGRIAYAAWTPPSGNRRSRRREADVLDLMHCSGTGTAYLANLAQHLHVLALNGEKMVITNTYVLALDATLNWHAVAVENGDRIAGVGSRALEFSGTGSLVLMTSGRPLVLPVEPGQYVYGDADAVVGWSSGLEVQLQAQSSNTEAWRRRGTATEGWELSFTGQGYVIVQPNELLPPQRVPRG